MAKAKVKRHASALKAGRKAEARRVQNYQVRSRVRTLTSKVLKDIAAKNVDAAKASFRIAQSAWQKAAKSGIFPKATASRKISNLASRLASLSAGR